MIIMRGVSTVCREPLRWSRAHENGESKQMRIKLNSVLVADQEKALAFYTNVLGFEKNLDIPMGDARWLTVVSPEGPDDIELLLEPTVFPPVATYQKALFDAGIPLTAFAVDDVRIEYDKLMQRGVEFRTGPTDAGTTTMAVFEDTCGNLIQIYEG